MNPQKLLQSVQLLLEANMSYRQIGAIVGISHNTVRRYRRILEKKQLSWNDVQNMSADQLERLLCANSGRFTNKRIPDWSYVHKELRRRDVTRALLWEEYRLSCPRDALSMSRFNELYSDYVSRLNCTMRQSHRAGERVFVDFAGRTVPWTDPTTGKEHKAQVFCGVMGCSNYKFAYAVASQSSPDVVHVHNKMFSFFGGVPQLIVPDNMKAAVDRPGPDLKINRIYLELANHYGIIVHPTRVRKPRDKAKVEVAVQVVQRWVLARLRNRKFFSIDEINAEISKWIEWLNNKKLRRLGATPRSLFEELDKPALKPLPAEPFESIEWTGTLKVASDYHVYVDKHPYSVPYQLAHERVQVKVRTRTVEFYFNNKRVACHPRSNGIGGESTLKEHLPPDHTSSLTQTPERHVEWAKPIGEAAVAAVRYQFRDRNHVIISVQACNSLRSLSKKYGPERFEAACRRAQSIGSLTVKSIRSILQRNLSEPIEHGSLREVSLPPHRNLRNAPYYAQGGR